MSLQASRNRSVNRVRSCTISTMAVLLTMAAALACGEDGFTPDCPEIPAYDLSRNPSTGAAYRHQPGDPETPLTASEEQQITDAINAGCITGPGDARSVDPEDL